MVTPVLVWPPSNPYPAPLFPLLRNAQEHLGSGQRDGEERGFLYRVDVRYVYQAAGDRYESTRYRFVDPFTDNGSAVETAVARFGPGAVVPCFVDPDDPRQAVLDRRVSPFLLIVLLPAAIADLGLWEVAGVGVEFWRRST
jgi:hypothetical protein